MEANQTTTLVIRDVHIQRNLRRLTFSEPDRYSDLHLTSQMTTSYLKQFTER